jgi:hypothetical protein
MTTRFGNGFGVGDAGSDDGAITCALSNAGIMLPGTALLSEGDCDVLITAETMGGRVGIVAAFDANEDDGVMDTSEGITRDDDEDDAVVVGACRSMSSFCSCVVIELVVAATVLIFGGGVV